MNKKYIAGIIGIIILIGIIFMLLSGSGVKRNSDELVVAVGTHGGEPKTGFDPILGWNYYAEPLIQSTLFKRDNQMNLNNDLAKSYTLNPDGLKYYVTIRDDVKFSDNSSLTAEDVAFTYNKLKEVGASEMDLSSMNSSNAINNTTVEFKLNNPDSTFINKMCYIGIVPGSKYDNQTYGKNPIGSGPYKLIQWDKGQQVIFELNNNYYGKKPEFKKLTMIFSNGDAAFASAKKGEVDIAEVPLSLTKEEVNNMVMTIIPSIDTRGISLPYIPNNGTKTSEGRALGNNVTSDISIRKALNYGINRQTIIDGPLNGHGSKSFDGVTSQLPWYNPDANIEDGKIDEAKQILEDGDWKIGNDGIREKNGLRASFELYYRSSDQDRQTLSLSVSEEAKKLGIEIKPVGKSQDDIDNFKNSQAVIWGWGSIDPTIISNLYSSKLVGHVYYNPSGYNNSKVDNYIEEATNSLDINNSYNIWKKVSWDGNTGISPKGDAAWLWLVTMDYSYFVDNNLNISPQTTTIQPHGGDIFGNIYEWKRIKKP
ncbi:MAG: ABC transporter substrate-binding protein [Methanobrevibacter sp.]|jgi:peptide/nickel transport system substrate-binding protein|nr:ABC transporter substrate-binding protein [Candidatus Methanovirga basalitermitum]